jgi:hypothetical protein
MTTRREHIEATIDDLVSSFLYYDRKEDEDLPRFAIEAALEGGEISVDEIIARFGTRLRKDIFK